MNYYDKWDIYSVSLLYLHILGNMSRFFSLKQTFISKIIKELYLNLHPDPSKREHLGAFMRKVNIFLGEEKDWGFVNTLSIEKMTALFKILSI